METGNHPGLSLLPLGSAWMASHPTSAPAAAGRLGALWVLTVFLTGLWELGQQQGLRRTSVFIFFKWDLLQVAFLNCSVDGSRPLFLPSSRSSRVVKLWGKPTRVWVWLSPLLATWLWEAVPQTPYMLNENRQWYLPHRIVVKIEFLYVKHLEHSLPRVSNK